MRLLSWTLLASLALGACDDDKDDDTGDAAPVDDTGTGLICVPVDIPCEDDIISDLSLHDDKISEGEVTTTTDGDDFVTLVDATAGGYGNESRNPWVYVKFTATGAERVDIDDETALESMDWDLGLRRFLLRLNSGDSGPSCVGADTLSGESYDDITSVPSDVDWAYEDFYDDDCEIDGDNSGLPDSPNTTIGHNEWWTYVGCVQTTMNPHLVQLADGSVIKLVIETYYLNDQDVCNDSGSGGTTSGWITLRWRMLE